MTLRDVHIKFISQKHAKKENMAFRYSTCLNIIVMSIVVIKFYFLSYWQLICLICLFKILVLIEKYAAIKLIKQNNQKDH